MKYKLICFDVDGTLTINEASIWYRITVGLGLERSIHEEILKRMDAGELSVEGATKELSDFWKGVQNSVSRDKLKEILQTVPLRPEAMNVLQELGTTFKIALLSGTPETFLEILGEKLKFNYMHSSSKFIFDDDNNFLTFEYADNQRKAKSRAFDDMLNILKIPPKQVVMVGNGLNDLGVFEKAGLSFAMADTSSDEVKAKADYVISSLEELLNYLK